MTGKLDPLQVSVKEAADLIGCSTWTVYCLLNSGEVEGRYLGSRRKVLYRSLRQYVENLPVDPPEAS